MKKHLFLLLLFLCCCVAVFGQAVTAVVIPVDVANQSATPLTSHPVVIPLSSYRWLRSALVMRDGQEVPYQLDDLDGDGYFDELCFLTDLKPHEQLQFSVELSSVGQPHSYEPQVYAEMLLSNKKIKEENKQDLYISSLTVDRGTNPYWQLHHHGPAFENRLVGYRVYFDHRQTVDIYGKYREGLELHDTQFYPDSTQKASGFGDDVLWVGSTLGLGTLRGWDGEQPVMLDDVQHRTLRIIARGPLRTVIEVVDEGWNAPSTLHPSPSTLNPPPTTLHPQPSTLTMTTRYTLYAGRRDCMVDIRFSYPSPTALDPLSSTLNSPSAFHQFCTGVINVKNSTEYTDREGLRGCWGTDWPVSAKDSVGHKRETVGLGICLPRQNIVSELPADKRNYAFVVSAPTAELHYAVTFCSDNEQPQPAAADSFGSIHSAEAWFTYLQAWKQRLTAAVEVSF